MSSPIYYEVNLSANFVIPEATVFDVVPIDFVLGSVNQGNYTGTIKLTDILNNTSFNFYRIGYLEATIKPEDFKVNVNGIADVPADNINIRIVSYNYEYFNTLLLGTSQNSLVSPGGGATAIPLQIDMNQLPITQKLTIAIRADYF